MLGLPFPSTDIHALADWVEVSCIFSTGGRCSLGDLSRQLKQSSVLEDENLDSDSLEADVVNELLNRANAASDSYPFTVDGSKVLLKSDFEDFLPYTFCLCLSYFGDNRRIGVRLFPRRLFEAISCLAAGSYLKGESVRFGSPRDTLPAGFDEAIGKLCLLIGEGGGLKERGFRKGQDDTLDVVAWRDSPDKRPGKLLLFGQCASGKNWKEKASELQPPDFCDTWLINRPISIVKAFFVPCSVDSSDWALKSIRAGIIFDRCRISYWVKQSGQFPQRPQCLKWCRSLLRRRRN